MLMQSQLRWCGHVHRMPDSRIPKQLLYGQLTGSTRSQGGQRKRYKDYLRLTLKSCDISNLTWDSTASDRAKWRRLCHSSLDQFESQRIANLEDRRACRKDPTSAQKSTVGTFSCEHCGRTCTSKIGMFAYRRSCNPSSTTVCQPRAATSSDVTSTASSTTVLTCSNCGRTCSSRIGMFSHQRVCHR